MRKHRGRQKKSTNCAAAVFADVIASNTLIPKHTIKIMWSRFSCQERLDKKFGNSAKPRHENRSKMKSTKPGLTMRKLVFIWLKFHSWLRKPLGVNAALNVPGEIKGFYCKSCYLGQAFIYPFYERNIITRIYHMAQCHGPPRSYGKVFFWSSFLFGRNIFKVLGTPRKVNPARAIAWLVSVTIILLCRFSKTILLHLASFYATKYLWKKIN